MQRSVRRILFLGLIVLDPFLLEAASKPDAIQNLLSHPPFGSQAPNPVPAAASNQPIEFRGVLEEQGDMLFSIYETGNRRSVWVEMKKPTGEFRIEAYDEATENVTVFYQGRSLQLTLTSTSHKPRAAKAPPAPLARIRTAEMEEAEKYHDRPFRIGHVAEEMEIRLAVRRTESMAAESPQPTAGQH